MVIVAAVDRSNRTSDVIKQAKILAEAFNDTIHVVHVLTRSEFVDLERTSVEETGTTLEIDQVHNVASEIADEAAVELDFPYEPIGLMGDPSDRIVEYANEQNARYIVVAGRRRSPAGKAVFGSVTQSILLNAKTPVVSHLNG